MSGTSGPATPGTDLEKGISEELFNNGEFERLLKRYDSNGGIETLLESLSIIDYFFGGTVFGNQFMK